MPEHTAITRPANPAPARGHHKDRRPRARLRLRAGTAVLALGALSASLAVAAAPAAAKPLQVVLSTRFAPIITTDGLQFRDLRAKAATDKADTSGDIRQAQKQLGHSSVTTTEGYTRNRRGATVGPTR